MRLTELSFLVAAVTAMGALRVDAAPTPELLDLAARVHYAYYHGEPRTLEAAATALERAGDSKEARYYQDFAALRRAQLGGAGRANAERVRACAQREVSVADKRVAAEAWVLAAACAFLAGDERRCEAALAAARERDDDNPRIGLVEAWTLEAAARDDPAQRNAVAEKLAAVVAAFDAWSPSIDDPDWGHAEALTSLAAAALEAGEVRRARDLLERALLLVPDYRTAVELRTALSGVRMEGSRL